MWSRRVRCALACAMVAAPLTHVTAQPTAGVPAIRVQAEFGDVRAKELADTARRAVDLYADWFGPYPFAELVVTRAPWHTAPSPPRAGAIAVATRWVELHRDPSAERALIAALAAHYWLDALLQPPDQRWFAEALVRYSATRAIETMLEGRQYWSSRFFGGFVPFASRALPLSPPGAEARGHIPRFDEMATVESSDSRHDMVRRATAALFTLERFIGWPALHQGLRHYRASEGEGAQPGRLAAVLSEQRGSDLSWFFDEALRLDREFDYGVDEFTVAPDGSRFHVRVGLRRFGNAVFGAGGSAGPPIRVVLTLADGSEVVDQWKGGEATRLLEYDTVSAAVQVAVDPNAMLLLDRDRTNNVRRRLPAPATPVGVRGTLSWLLWLEDLMLTCLALV